MKLIYDPHRSRFERSYARIRNAYLHKEPADLPILISDVNCALGGQSPDGIPDDYFTDVKVMFDYQVAKIEKHLATYDDDYIPVLIPWYGIGVVPSALGCRIAFPPKMDPAVESAVLKEPGDIRRLSPPDPHRDGLMPRVLETMAYMHEHSDLPVSFTDAQGPLSIAIGLCGATNFFLWIHDHPNDVHEIMDFCTEVLIEWIKVQKKHVGQKLDGGAFPHGIALPDGFGGVWISDDDCTALSPDMYEQFAVPYNSRVFEAFGGGTLHFCGSAEHQLENFLKIKGLTGINNFCMGNFRQIAKMQALYEDRLAIMLCDFTPLQIEDYYRKLFDNLRLKGLIVATFVVPEFALHQGKCEAVSRSAIEAGETAWRTLRRLAQQRAEIERKSTSGDAA